MIPPGRSTNAASIEISGGEEKTSNTVEAAIAQEFTITTEQRIEGEPSYTASKVSGKVAQTVEYLITVNNTGAVAFTGTIGAGGGGAVNLTASGALSGRCGGNFPPRLGNSCNHNFSVYRRTSAGDRAWRAQWEVRSGLGQGQPRAKSQVIGDNRGPYV